jgi:hypothetical protein
MKYLGRKDKLSPTVNMEAAGCVKVGVSGLHKVDNDVLTVLYSHQASSVA